ncbi:MAG: aminopeptidase P family protein [Firmicutes bacterium]|nr:aminopeptidase P family protein [Bacillota bacterium]
MSLTRLQKLQDALAAQDLAGLIISKAENIRYLSGFTGSTAWLFVLKDKAYLCTDYRYSQQAAAETSNWEVVEIKNSNWQQTIQSLCPSGQKKIGFESHDLNYQSWYKLTQTFSKADLSPTFGLVERLRVQKDEQELASLRQAIVLADKGAEYLRSILVPGRTEKEVALELEFFLRKHGAERAAFPFIVASGTRGALPHGTASEKKIQAGELVTVDFGAVYQGYHSDLTRTFVLGKPTDKQVAIYELVLEAQEKAIASAGPGVLCVEVDSAARDVIAGANYGNFFGHATGHGLGLAVHEAPHVSSRSADTLLPGMVITVEPGVYIPGWGGVRTEDVLLITDQGVEILSRAAKKPFIL